MGVQVVHNKYDPVTVRISRIHQIPDFLSPVNCGTALSDTYMPRATQRFRKYKDTIGVVTRIFGINLPGISQTRRQRLLCLTQQLVRLFVYTYYRYIKVIGHFVNVQDVLHAGYKFHVFFGRDASVGIFVRSKFILMSGRWLLSLPGYQARYRLFLTRAKASSANILRGMEPQAIWMIWASNHPSTFCNAVLELGLIL